MSRSARLIAAAGMVVAGIVPGLPVGQSSLAATCQFTKTGSWAGIRQPTWPAQPTGERHTFPKPAVSVAVDPGNPARLFASNGTDLMRSTNGGCSWTTVFSLAPGGATASSGNAQPWLDPRYFINAIVIAGRGASLHVYVTLTDFLGLVAGIVWADPVYLSASPDGGQTWTTHQVVVGGPQAFVTAAPWSFSGTLMTSPTDPKTVYWDTEWYGPVVLYGSTDHTTLLVSHDAGTTWTVASQTQRGSAGNVSENESEQVDPVNSKVIWRAYDGYPGTPATLAVLRSTDGGRSFHAALTGQPPGAEVYDPPFVDARPNGPRSCVVAHSPGTVAISTNTGSTWRRLPAIPALDGLSGVAYIEGAACLDGSRVVALAGYQPQRPYAPPFARSALFESIRGGRWIRLATLPVGLGEGSLTVTGPAGKPNIFWFGLNAKANPKTTYIGDYVWYRYIGRLR